MQINWIDILRATIAAAVVAGFLACFCGCATAENFATVTVNDSVRVQQEVRVDTVYRDRWHTEKIKGDTVYVHDSVERYVYKYRTLTDSVYVRDSIPYPVEVVREVRVRNAYDRFTARGFWVFVGIIFLYIAWKLLSTKIRAFLGV